MQSWTLAPRPMTPRLDSSHTDWIGGLANPGEGWCGGWSQLDGAGGGGAAGGWGVRGRKIGPSGGQCLPWRASGFCGAGTVSSGATICQIESAEPLPRVG